MTFNECVLFLNGIVLQVQITFKMTISLYVPTSFVDLRNFSII